jgi:Cu/Ag efflux pump CusA
MPSREIEDPMAIIILSGLLTSAVLNPLVLPTRSPSCGRFAAIAASADKA